MTDEEVIDLVNYVASGLVKSSHNDLLERCGAVLEIVLAPVIARLDRLESMVIPADPTGLCDPHDISYMVLTFFDNGGDAQKGKSRYVLKVEANREHKVGSIKYDFNLFANLASYDVLRKYAMSTKAKITDEQRASLLAKIAPYSADSDHLMGLVTIKGGKTGTKVIEDQLVIAKVTNRSLTPVVEKAMIYVGDTLYVTRDDGWKTTDKKGLAFKADNIVAKSWCYPIDEYERLAEGDDDAE